MGGKKIPSTVWSKLWSNFCCNGQTNGILSLICNCGILQSWHQSDRCENGFFIWPHWSAYLRENSKEDKNGDKQTHDMQAS